MTSTPTSPTSRWTAGLVGLKAISIKQPWAWLIVNGFKDVENRSWRTHYRGPVLIHAGLSARDFNDDTADDVLAKYGIEIPKSADAGGIVGIADIVGCHAKHPSRWHVKGNYAWELANARRLSFRACRGALGFFRPIFTD